MDNAQIARFEPLRTLAFGGISATYAAVGTPFLNAEHIISFDNTTDAQITISFDGVNDHLIVPSEAGKVFDLSTNRIGIVQKLMLPQNMQVYAKQTSTGPTLGAVYVSVVYASNH
jgi:hypothetical protein